MGEGDEDDYLAVPEGILLDSYSSAVSKRAAVEEIYKHLENQEPLKFSNSRVLNSLLQIVNDDQDATNKQRIQACRILSSVMEDDGGSGKRWADIPMLAEDEEEPSTSSPPMSPSEEGQQSLKNTKRKRRKKKRLSLPHRKKFMLPPATNKRIASKPSVVGVLMGSDSRNVKQNSSESRMGYVIPMMWYPGSTTKKTPSRKLQRLDATDQRLPPIDTSANQSNDNITIEEEEEQQEQTYNNEEEERQAIPKTSNNNSDLEDASELQLQKVLDQERALWFRLDRDIKRHRLELPTQFLLEQGLEVAYSRQVAKQVLERLFSFAGRGPMGAAFNVWREFTLAERFKEFVKFANTEKVRKIIRQMFEGKKLLAFQKWVEAVEFERLQERIRYALLCQRKRRGVLGRRKFSIHKRRWYASRKLQTWVRCLNQNYFYKSMKAASIIVQKYERKWAVERMIVSWNRKAMLIQCVERMRVQRWYFLELKAATIMIQSEYRGVLGRKIFKVLMHHHMLRFQLEWSCAVVIQSFWYTCMAKRTIARVRHERLALNNAALKVQVAWYRNKGQFSAFVLMRSYLIQDEADKTKAFNERRDARRIAVVKIQSLIRCLQSSRLYARLLEEYRASRTAQACCRSFVSRQKVNRFSVFISKVKLIQHTINEFLRLRNEPALLIQRLWRSYHPKIISEQPPTVDFHILYDAATCIQSLYRVNRAKDRAARRRSIVVMQRVVRGHFARKLARQIYKQVCDIVVNTYVQRLLKDSHRDTSRRLYLLRMKSATKIQAFYKANMNRYNVTVIQKYIQKRSKSARVIQRAYRGEVCRREIRELKALDKRVRTNRYKRMTSPLEVAVNAIKHARAFYDPQDELCGMHPAEWLLRLGALKYWEAIHKGPSKVKDLSRLLTLPPKVLKSHGQIADEADLQLIVTMQKITALAPVDRAVLSHGELDVYDRFKLIRSPSILWEMYNKVFPDQETKANNFCQKIPRNKVSYIQLEKHLNQYRGRPKEARDNAVSGMMEYAGTTQSDLERWTVRRYKQCFAVYEMALESISKLQLTDDLKVIVKTCLRRGRAPMVKYHRRGCNELKNGLEMIVKAILAAERLQRAVRGKLARTLFHACLARRKYKQDILEGGLLKQQWREQREKEQKEYKEYCLAWKKYEVEQQLLHITRFGYMEIWDEYSQAYYYQNENDHLQISWERPIYAYEEDQACLVFQRNLRSFFARNLLKRLKEEERWKIQLQREQKLWESKEHERLQFLTFKINVYNLVEESAVNLNDIKLGSTLSWRKRPEDRVVDRRKARQRWANNPERKCVDNRRLYTWQGTREYLEECIDLETKRVDRAKLKLQTVEEEFSNIDSRTRRGFRFGDNWFPFTRTNKDYSGLYPSPHEAERCAMELEDKPYLAQVLGGEIELMHEEDCYSAKVEKVLFIESSPMLSSMFHYIDALPSGNAYDLKVQRRKELKNLQIVSSAIRGYLARLRLYKLSLQEKITLKKANVDQLRKTVVGLGKKLAALGVGAAITNSFTFVEPMYGWKEKKDGYGRKFFYNEFSGEPIWQRPTYRWEHEFAARTIERVYRGWRGRVAFIETLRADGIVDLVSSAIDRGKRQAWIGYENDEGTTVEMWFARRGMHSVLKETQESKPNSSKFLKRSFSLLMEEQTLPWTEESLKAIGISDDNLIQTVLLYHEQHPDGDAAEDVSVLRDRSAAEKLFLAYYPKQTARALKFSQQSAVLSVTPVTLRQLQRHLKKYRGKPSLATVQLQQEVFNLPTGSTPEKEEEAYYTFAGAVRRLMILLANMKIEYLHDQLSSKCRLASRLLTSGQSQHRPVHQEEDEEGIYHDSHQSYEDEYRINFEEVQPKPGPWFAIRRWPAEASAAYVVREGLELVLLWERMAARVQRKYRNYYALQQWRYAAAWYRAHVTIIQCAWRQHAARQIANKRYHQYHSPWEELYDPEEDTYYYFDNRYGISQWTVPDEYYKPHGWWPVEDLTVPEGCCFICKVEEACRRCEQCLNPEGVQQEFCFECFAQIHDFGGMEYANHTYVPVDVLSDGGGTSVAGGDGLLKCGQCGGPSIRRCEECADFYCLSCYRRLHTRGKRKEHSWTAYKPTARACVECEINVAAAICNECDDVYCKPCFAKLHRKGKRKYHVITKIENQVVKTGKGK